MLKQNKTKTVDNSIFHDGVRLPDCQAEEIECINLTRTKCFQRAGGGKGEGIAGGAPAHLDQLNQTSRFFGSRIFITQRICFLSTRLDFDDRCSSGSHYKNSVLSTEMEHLPFQICSRLIFRRYISYLVLKITSRNIHV